MPRSALLLVLLLPAGGCLGLKWSSAPAPTDDRPAPGDSDSFGDPGRSTTSLPRTEKSEATQQGLLNTAVQGVKGVELNQIMPFGLAMLLAFDKFLSHRREVMRIKQNGKCRPREPP